ncbi:hypothetical protein ANANG_G00016200 [Anguilla anguilla]|uniref:BAH domain-containing protein n=1 Tax=Anguilla anguilla TaxID=7936 RepID=A0A9D3MZN2_ANGAN|nr:hypothetical protein ANANG_G00016200 [Anguilla anguilla]
MTHAQIKDSLRRYPSERAERVGDRTHGETMGRAWPECPLRDGSTKQRMAKRRRAKEAKDLSSERDRKLYPLRGRVGMGDVGTRSCRVLLTRLEESGVQSPGQDGPEGLAAGPEKQSAGGESAPQLRQEVLQDLPCTAGTKTKPKAEKHAHPPAQEPRKRRLASLNAEAVNSLLLEREDPLQTARLAKKLQQQQQQQRLNRERASPKDPPGTAATPRKGPEVQKADLGRKPKRQKKAKPEGRGAEQLSLDSPAPRRLAGLNAAALLKLTSASSGAKRRLKADCKEACGAAAAVRGKQPHPKSRKQQHRPHGSQQAAPKGGCTACKKEALHPEVEWEGTAGATASTNQGRGGGVLPRGLALFLGRQAYSELEDHAPSSLKQEFPPPPHSLAHPTLAIGIPNPAFCGSVGSPCFGEACRVSSYAYRAMQPLASRRCSFSTACSGCTHKIKTEEFPSSLEDRSPSIPVWPALPLSSCPVPSVPPAALQTLLSDPSQPQAQLRVARECPQSAKPPSGSRSGVRNSTGCPHAGHGSNTGKQQRISRRRATNGWLPVGVPTEKEVFIVGEEETALRRCYEGVQRDGEVIRVRDTVLLRSGPRKKSLPYVAKISALWEDPETGEMMMSLFWYYRPEHTQGGRNPSMHCENEIFASRHQDENSVACIEDKCYVLTLAQYCRFCALVKRRGEGLPESAPVVPPSPEYAVPAHRRVPANIDPDLVFLCRHVYDFRYGRILKNLQ